MTPNRLQSGDIVRFDDNDLVVRSTPVVMWDGTFAVSFEGVSPILFFRATDDFQVVDWHNSPLTHSYK